MKDPKYTHPQALVPEFLTELSVEKLPLDRPYYIHPGELDEYDIGVFVDADSSLKLHKNYLIPKQAKKPDNPIGRIGIMKTLLINPTAESVQCSYVADLRFIGTHQLSMIRSNSFDSQDQEDYMGMIEMINDSVRFDAFIAPHDQRQVKNGIPESEFYGDPSLHEALRVLGDRGNNLMDKHRRNQKKAMLAAKATKESVKKESVSSKNRP